MPVASVTIAKYGTVQLPVSNAAPVKEAVAGLVPIKVVNADSTSPLIVRTPAFDEAFVVEDLGVTVAVLNDIAAEPTPSGEQPTKLGAVSFTVAHVLRLKVIAAFVLRQLNRSRKESKTCTLLIT